MATVCRLLGWAQPRGACAGTVRRSRRAVSLLAAAALLGSPLARAATNYWDGVSSSWTNVTSWSTAAGATTPDPSAVPGSGEDAVFNIGTANGAETITLDAAQAAHSLTFANTGTTVLRGNASGTTARSLTLGAGGLTLNAGAGAVTIGESPATYGTINVTIGAAQSWVNNSASALTVTGNNATAITLNNLLTIDGSGDTILANGANLAGSGGMRKIGSGTLTIKNVSSAGSRLSLGAGYGGNFTMEAGTLTVSPGSYFTLGEGGGGTATVSYTQTGGSATYTASGGLYIGNWTGGTGNNAAFAVSGGTFVQNAGIVYVGRQQTSGDCTAYLNIGGGAGTASFTAPSIYLGGAAANTINTAHVNLNANGTLETSLMAKPGGTGNLYFDGGTLKVRAGTTAGSTILSNVLNAAQIKNGGAIVDTAGINVTIAQVLANYSGHAGGLTKTGAGTLTLSGANTFSGDTRIEAGALLVANSALQNSAFDTAGAAGTAALTFSGTTPTIGGLVGSANWTVPAGITALTLNPGAGVTKTYAGVLGETTAGMTVTKTGAGTQVLSASNTYSGSTTVGAGLLLTTRAAVLPGYSTAGKIVFNGGTLGVQVGGAGWTTNEVDALLAAATKTSGALGLDTTHGDLVQWTPFTTANFGSALGLTKLGAGVLTLNATNTYAGNTAILGGTLSVASLSDAGPSAIGNSGTLTFGGGTLQFAGVSGGTVRALAFTGAGTFDVADGSMLAMTNGAWSGNGGVTKSGGGTLEVGTNTVSSSLTRRFIVDNLRGGNFTMTAGTLNVKPLNYFTLGDTSSSGTSVFHQTGGTVSFAPVNNTANSDVYVGNAGSPGELLVRGGAFEVTTTASQIRVGQATAGTLTIGGGASAASVTTPKVSIGAGAGNGVVHIVSNGTLVTAAIADGGGSGTSSLYLDGGTVRVISNFTSGAMLSGLNVAQIKNGGATFDTNGKDATNAAAFANFAGHSGSFTKVGAGTLTMSADYSAGVVTVGAGTLTVNSPTGDGFNPSTKTILVNSNATLKLGGGHKIENSVMITLNSGASFDLGGQSDAIGGLTGTGALMNTGMLQTLTLDLPSSSSFDGLVTGNVSLQLRGYVAGGAARTFTLNNPGNNFAGEVTIGDNTTNMRGDPILVLGAGGVIPDTAVVTVLGSVSASSNGYYRGTLDLNGYHETIAGLAGGAPTAGDKYGTVLNNGASDATLTVNVAAGSQTFSGIMADGTKKVSLVKSGAGIQVLAGANTFTGGTRIEGGTLTLGQASDTLSDMGAVEVNGGTLAIGANSDTVGAVILTDGSITGTSGILTGTGVNYDVRKGSISAILGGMIGLDKSTADTVTLTGANTYSGGTTIGAGALLVNNAAGSGTGNGVVTVHGGTLGGTGAIAGAIGFTAGILAPGNSVGTLTANGGLALSASATYAVEIDWDGVGTPVGGVYYPTAGTQYDQLIIGGGQFAASNASLTVSLLNAYGPMENLAAFRIVAGAFEASTFGVSSVTSGSHTYLLEYGAYDGVNNGIWLVEVPEPSVLGLLALAGLVGARRRRQGRAMTR